jgi:hypothetical protein
MKSLSTQKVMGFAICLALSASAAFASDDLVDQYPQTEQVTLSTGDVVKLPFLVRNAAGVVLVGTADLKKLNGYLGPEGLQAVPVLPNRGLILFFSMNYSDSTLGKYQELVIQVLSTSAASTPLPLLHDIGDLGAATTSFLPLLNNATDSIHKDSPFFMWKLFVTTPLALTAGREIWGYPKSLADVNVSGTFGDSSFVVNTDGSEMVRAEKNHSDPLRIPLSIDMRMISPKEIKQVSSRGMAKGQAEVSLFDSKTDVFELGTSTEWGSTLTSVDYKPLMWIVMPQLEAVFFKP